MGYYFDDSQSINAYEGTDPQAIISSLAYRYMGQNLKHGLYYRAYTNNGIVRTTDYRYLVDFNKIFLTARTRNVYGHSQSSIQPVNLHSVGI